MDASFDKAVINVTKVCRFEVLIHFYWFSWCQFNISTKRLYSVEPTLTSCNSMDWLYKWARIALKALLFLFYFLNQLISHVHGSLLNGSIKCIYFSKIAVPFSGKNSCSDCFLHKRMKFECIQWCAYRHPALFERRISLTDSNGFNGQNKYQNEYSYFQWIKTCAVQKRIFRIFVWKFRSDGLLIVLPICLNSIDAIQYLVHSKMTSKVIMTSKVNRSIQFATLQKFYSGGQGVDICQKKKRMPS